MNCLKITHPSSCTFFALHTARLDLVDVLWGILTTVGAEASEEDSAKLVAMVKGADIEA